MARVYARLLRDGLVEIVEQFVAGELDAVQFTHQYLKRQRVFISTAKSDGVGDPDGEEFDDAVMFAISSHVPDTYNEPVYDYQFGDAELARRLGELLAEYHQTESA